MKAKSNWSIGKLSPLGDILLLLLVHSLSCVTTNWFDIFFKPVCRNTS